MRNMRFVLLWVWGVCFVLLGVWGACCCGPGTITEASGDHSNAKHKVEALRIPLPDRIAELDKGRGDRLSK